MLFIPFQTTENRKEMAFNSKQRIGLPYLSFCAGSPTITQRRSFFQPDHSYTLSILSPTEEMRLRGIGSALRCNSVTFTFYLFVYYSSKKRSQAISKVGPSSGGILAAIPDRQSFIFQLSAHCSTIKNKLPHSMEGNLFFITENKFYVLSDLSQK